MAVFARVSMLLFIVGVSVTISWFGIVSPLIDLFRIVAKALGALLA